MMSFNEFMTQEMGTCNNPKGWAYVLAYECPTHTAKFWYMEYEVYMLANGGEVEEIQPKFRIINKKVESNDV